MQAILIIIFIIIIILATGSIFKAMQKKNVKVPTFKKNLKRVFVTQYLLLYDEIAAKVIEEFSNI